MVGLDMLDSAETIDIAQEDIPVTAIITHIVRKGREQGYEEWFRGIAAAARMFRGHQGVSTICPQDRLHPEYVVILKFDQYRNLKNWLESDVRREWIERLQPLIEQPENIKTLTGLETWFALPNQKTPPPRYKMAIVTWLAVFSVISIVSPLLAPILTKLPPILVQLITTGIVVLILTYLVMPYLTKLLKGWLYPKR
jgi:antibiotic biosynthesis monooxygenase (ABM) superfamily enzyme